MLCSCSDAAGVCAAVLLDEVSLIKSVITLKVKKQNYKKKSFLSLSRNEGILCTCTLIREVLF